MCVLLQIGIALDETVTSGDLEDLMAVFNCSEEVKVQWVGPGHSRKGCPGLTMLRTIYWHPPADDHC